MIPRVVDISHYEVIDAQGFRDAAASGIWGIICKSSQGIFYKDIKYNQYVQMARDAGLLVGAYHFNEGQPPADQVDHFIDSANPQADTLMALDYEDWPKSNMSIQDMVQFLHIFEEKMKHKAVLYSGNRLKDHWNLLNDSDKAYVCSHKLWLAQYGNNAQLPSGFNRYFLWQYTGDGFGPEPHWVPGIHLPGGKGLDLNTYNGTQEEFNAEWGKETKQAEPPKVPNTQTPTDKQPSETPKEDESWIQKDIESDANQIKDFFKKIL